MSRLKVLVVAYFCAPAKGSEEGVGWRVPFEMARHHDIWAITCEDNRPAIEAELAQRPRPGLQFVYWDLPRWARSWHRGRRGGHLHYYLWQLCILGIVRKLHTEREFDLIHHVTFVRYSTPSFVCFLGIPFIWGPVGGGESAPRSFWRSGGWRSVAWEALRELARRLAEHGPFLRATARRSAIALATTPESAARMRALGCKNVEILSEVGLFDDEFKRFDRPINKLDRTVRFVSISKLVHWKGTDISLRAFAEADIRGAELWIFGDGPYRQHLESLCARLGIAARVRFFGHLPREAMLSRLKDCDIIVHPSLHDGGGWAVLEAMAAGLPVICLDLGGPAVQVTANCGFKIPARDPDQAVRAVAAAMTMVANDQELRHRLGRGARERVKQEFLWSSKAERFNMIYQQVLADKGWSPSKGSEGERFANICGFLRRPARTPTQHRLCAKAHTLTGKSVSFRKSFPHP
jgi:glycosyltransferase involved in cell wall biosynthesis